MLKLKLQYIGHWMPRVDSLEYDPDAGNDWKQEEKGMTEDEMVGLEFEPALGDVKDLEAWCAAVLGIIKSQTQLSNWTTTTTVHTCENVWHEGIIHLIWNWNQLECDELLLQKQTPCKCLTWIKTWYFSCRFCHWLSSILVRAGRTQRVRSPLHNCRKGKDDKVWSPQEKLAGAVRKSKMLQYIVNSTGHSCDPLGTDVPCLQIPADLWKMLAGVAVSGQKCNQVFWILNKMSSLTLLP